MAAPLFRFTSYDLDSCIELADAVQRNGGLLSSDQLAHHLEYKSANNGSFNTRLGNARLFGLVEGSSGEIRPTQRALTILHPDYPHEAERARVAAFEAVPLYGAVLNQYHGQPLPDETGLKNALATRWSISTDKVAMVYARMMDSAEQAGLFRQAGNRSKMLRPSPLVGTAIAAPMEAVPDPVAPAPRVVSSVAHGAAANKLVQAALDELPAPGDVTEEQLVQWLQFFESALRVVYRLPAVGGTR
jgi:hypothetical protein